MSISKTLLPEFDHEMANTRKYLERLPDDKLAWKPHQKSWTMGELATHIVNIPDWAVYTINMESLDLAPAGGPPIQMPKVSSRKGALELLDKNIAAARTAIAGASDESLRQPWTLLAGGKTIFTLPRIAVLRGFVMNHGIHHRAQLGVYYRLNDVPVPGIYGPSADEGNM